MICVRAVEEQLYFLIEVTKHRLSAILYFGEQIYTNLVQTWRKTLNSKFTLIILINHPNLHPH